MTARPATGERRYFIISLDATHAHHFAHAVCSHWASRTACTGFWTWPSTKTAAGGHGAENFSMLRRIALNMLRHEATNKVGIKTKRLRAGWDEQCLLKVLATPI